MKLEMSLLYLFLNKALIWFELLYLFTQAFNDLEELLDQNDICIAIKERLTKDSGVAASSSYDNIVKKLATKPNSKGLLFDLLVLFTQLEK